MIFKQEKIVLLSLCIVSCCIGYITDQPTIRTLGIMGWIGLIQLAYSIISWIKRGNQIVSPYIIFLLTLYVFSYGQSFMWAFGLDSERTLIGFYGVTIQEIFHAQVLTVVMLAFFHIGAIYSLIKKRAKAYNIYNTTNQRKRLQQIGWLLFLVSIVPYIVSTVHDLILSMTMGYGAIYDDDKVGIDNLSGFIADYFIPSVICLFIAYKSNRLIRLLLLALLSVNIIAILLIGGRSNAVILISILIILYNYLVKRFTKKWIVVGVLGGFILLQVLSFVASTRTEGGRTANINNVEMESNAAVDALAEMGGSMFCLIKTMDLVPRKVDYRYGKSYVYSFTTLIPNVGIWKIHPAKKESNLGDWLTDALGLGYGTGFSMCAEAYANFGYCGFILFFFWGWFLANIFGKIEISAKTNDYALMAFLLVLFWYFLKLPRNNFINLVRPIFFVAGPIYWYCNNFKLRR